MQHKTMLTRKLVVLTFMKNGEIAFHFFRVANYYNSITCFRLCLQYKSKEKIDKTKHYRGMGDAFYKIVKYEGLQGLYKVI